MSFNKKTTKTPDDEKSSFTYLILPIFLIKSKRPKKAKKKTEEKYLIKLTLVNVMCHQEGFRSTATISPWIFNQKHSTFASKDGHVHIESALPYIDFFFRLFVCVCCFIIVHASYKCLFSVVLLFIKTKKKAEKVKERKVYLSISGNPDYQFWCLPVCMGYTLNGNKTEKRITHSKHIHPKWLDTHLYIIYKFRRETSARNGITSMLLPVKCFPHNNTICLHTIANHHKRIYYLFFIIFTQQ